MCDAMKRSDSISLGDVRDMDAGADADVGLGTGIGADTRPPASLLGPTDIRAIARALGVNPTKKLGQNFVHDASTVRKIVAESGVRAGDRVLEIGPGLGSLTLALLEVGAFVSAVEIDPVLAAALPQTVMAHQSDAASRLAVLRADALDLKEPQQLAVPPAWAAGSADSATSGDPISSVGLIGSVGSARSADSVSSADSANTVAAVAASAEDSHTSAHTRANPSARTSASVDTIFEPTHVVANLPYNVAVPILFTLLAALPSVRRVTVMVQAEVADRLAAQPGSKVYGIPSVKLSWYGRARRGVKISRTVFWPVPNVDSALVHVDVIGRGGAAAEVAGADAMNSSTCDPGRHSPGSNTEAERYREAERERVFALIDAAFAQRRKTLRSALAGWAGSPARAEQVLRQAGIDPRLRGENLVLADFIAIARAL